MSLEDLALVHAAKKQFLEDYKTEISNLGYNLAVGITSRITVGIPSRESGLEGLAIAVRIQSSGSIPEETRELIESILPNPYIYNNQSIPVQLRYIGIPKRREER